MSSLATLARPYAKAAFELARDEQALGPWEDMLTLASTITVDEAMQALLDSPEVSQSEAAKLITETGGAAFSDRFNGFVAVLAGYGRLALLPEITGLYRQLRDEAEKRLQVRVVSAVPLDDSQSERMREALARRFDCNIELENEIDRSVIGGAIIYAGDEVIDGSLRGRLQQLSSNLAN
jgi:F-type H+-transporting ATPase subunit delta